MRPGVSLLTLLLAALVAQAGPRISVMDPAPGSTVTSATSVVLTLNGAVDATTVSAATVSLIYSGPDLAFGTGDDAPIVPTSIAAAGNVITLDLTGLILSDGFYRVTLSGAPTPPAAVANLLAHWGMNEGSGGTTADASGNAHTGTLNGAAWTSGLFGNALSFNGGATRVDVDAGVVTPNWTVSLWVHRKGDVAGTAATLLDSSAPPSGTSLRLEQIVTGDQVGITEYTVVDYGFGFVAPLDDWVHLAFTSDASNARLFVNGTLRNTAPRGYDLHVGKLGSATTLTTHSLIGFMDEVQIYSRVLSDPEIAALAVVTGGIRSGAGKVLDGEFAGSLPSGNGSGGGDFVASFTVLASFVPPSALPVLTVGGCGLVGLELSLPALLILVARRARRRR